jgi:hypothetical protein
MLETLKLIEFLEKLSKKKVVLQETEITSKLKNEFYSPVAAFEREAQRVISFYEKNLPTHKELKGSYIKFKRAYNTAKAAFKLTEIYLSSPEVKQNIVKNPEIPSPESQTNNNE